MLYRFAVMEVESWILAHREAVSEFLSVPVRHIPENTDTIPRPKEFLVALARKSRSKSIRRDIAPRRNSTARVGPDYNGRLSTFVTECWEAGIAIDASPSLERALRRIETFEPTWPEVASPTVRCSPARGREPASRCKTDTRASS